MVTREKFIEIMEKLTDVNKKEMEVFNYLWDRGVRIDCDYSYTREDLMIDLLSDILGDKEEWIQYYLWDLDGDFGKSCVQDGYGNVIRVSDWGDVYDLIKSTNAHSSGDNGEYEVEISDEDPYDRSDYGWIYDYDWTCDGCFNCSEHEKHGAAGKKNSGWISVEDAMPEDYKHCLVWCHVNDVSWIEMAMKSEEKWLLHPDDGYDVVISHWMYVPDLPEEDYHGRSKRKCD